MQINKETARVLYELLGDLCENDIMSMLGDGYTHDKSRLIGGLWGKIEELLAPEIEKRKAIETTKEAHILLDLISDEFQSDPMSVQCFDLRIVERVKKCVQSKKEIAHLN